MGRLKLIIGAAGSGKTQRILEDVARKALESPFPSTAHPPLLVIVPEQQAMQTERAVYAQMAKLSGRASASARVNVMSFSRLASVLRTRAGQEYQPLGDLGRRMLVWKLLGKGGKAKAEVLAGLIGELTTNGVKPGELGGDSAPPLHEKITELSKVYLEYCNACTDCGLDFLHPTCGIEGLLLEENWKFLADTEVWIDGFLGFTAPEQRAVCALLSHCKAVNAAVLIDPAQTVKPDVSAFADWFKPTRELVAWWKGTATKLGIACEVQGLPSLPRWDENNPLSRLAMLPATLVTSESARFAEAVACGDERSEVDFAARKVKELVTSRGLRYNDISIITRDIKTYAGLINARFADHGIPAFIDKRRSLTAHPAVVLFLSGLKMSLALNQLGDAQTLLKTELLPGGENTRAYREDVSLLEQAYTTTGKRPNAWLGASRWDADDEKTDKLRKEILAPVLGLKTAFDSLADAEKTLQTVLGLAWENLLPERVATLLEAWAVKQENDNPVEAQLHRSVLAGISKTLQALVDIAGDETLTAGELCGWLEYSFAELTLGDPPPVLDSVLVTDIERGRHHPVKAAIVIGMAADTWPQPHSESAYFNDAERRLLSSSGERLLGDSAAEKSAKEPYFAMVAVTRPTHSLTLTRPISDAQGKAREPAGFFNHFGKLLGISETYFSSRGDNAELESIATLADLAVAAALGGNSGALNNLLDEITTDSQDEVSAVVTVARGWYGSNAQSTNRQARLDSAQMQRLLPGPDYAMSASRLESFAACPFKHFAHYYLGLKEQNEPVLDALQLGSFYHEVLQRIVETLIRQGYDWVQGSVEEFKNVARAVLAEQSKQLNADTKRGRSALIHDRALVLLDLHAQEIAKLAEASGRVPLGVEICFGDKHGDSLPAVRLPLGSGELVLGGKIDRVDLGSDGSAAVVDYKLSAKGVDWQLFLAGAQIQLPLYLMAVEGQVLQGQDSKTSMQASSATYVPIEPSWNAKSNTAELKAGALIPTPRKKADAAAQDKAADIAKVISATSRIVGEHGERILDGEFAPQPLRQPGSGKFFACTYCSFAPVCRFDPLAGGQVRLTELRKGADLRDEVIGSGGEQHGG